MNHVDCTAWRYRGDAGLMDALKAEDLIRQRLASPAYALAKNANRTELLGGAVMVDPDVLPHLAVAVTTLQSRFVGLKPVECFVYNNPEINAFITEGRSRIVVCLSSATVNHLDAEELTVILGHEFGHAVYGHIDMLAGHLAADAAVPPAATMRVRAWQRASEISADRAGLMLGGSLAAAARTLFKVASGIVSPAVAVAPDKLAGQWQKLVDEVIQEGDRTFHHFSHPFPPLRMRAMQMFWDAWHEPESGRAEAIRRADDTIDRMLATMDPAVTDDRLGDPMLSGHFFWGGLYLATRDGDELQDIEHARLASVAPAGIDVGAAATEAAAAPEQCRERFAAVSRDRRRKLTAVEIHRIIFGLLDVAAADGVISEAELAGVRELGGLLGVPPHACDLVVEHYRKENVDDR